MDKPLPPVYEFGNFRLDAAKRLLLKDDEAVPLMPKAFDTLLYLVEHSGNVIERDELMTAIWADTIVEENNLTQNISSLRRLLGEKHGENQFIATVPGHGYKFVAAVRRVSETDTPATPELAGSTSSSTLESKATAAATARMSDGSVASRFWLIALIVVGALGLSSFGIYRWREGRELGADAPIKVLAVLPFKPLVAGKRDEALELGMADTLISKLSNGEGIIVRPFGAIRSYNSWDQDSLKAGRELGVEAVLDGSIQTSGERIRIAARLLRTRDGKQLWAGQFDEKLNDIFAVQDSISERVAAALRIQLGQKKRNTENVEAYDLYMRGQYHAQNLTRAETDKGIAYFQQAIQIDPNYARPHIGQARAYLAMALTSGLPSEQVVPKAKAAALRAIEIDETVPEAHVALGWIYFWYDWNWALAEKECLRALELNPNSAEAHAAYAHGLSNSARHEMALTEIRRSRELDPLSFVTNALEGQILFFAGRHDEALDRLQKTIDLNPNFWLGHLFISRVYTEKGMHAEAIAAAKKAGELSHNSQSDAYRAYALVRWGQVAEARAVLDELLKLSKENYVPPYNLAVTYNALGESEKAIEYLEKGFTEKDVRMVFLTVEPMWNPLRSNPRFVALLKRARFE
ncbi:MAG TPA: winged helix-turn-helix domain-containing protein [Pyrinomonadaceae bacterium]|nr:winged helix-turn-helix domain-containing protein [Pyrinomonadaceae bacterium]